MKRPSLPPSLYQPRALSSIAFIMYGLLMFFGCAFLTGYVAGAGIPLWVKTLTILVLILATQQGAHVMGWVGHEGIHLNLFRSRYLSALVGAFVGAAIFFPIMGYGISHWNHHRFTNQQSDPDAEIFPKFKTFWRRFFFARGDAQRSYLKANVEMALGRPLPFGYRLPFPAPVQRTLAWANLGFLMFWFLVYATVALQSPLTALLGIVLPLILVAPFSGLRAYVEHSGTGIGMFRDARSYVSPIYTVLFFCNNYHLEHHLYPTVPCYNLPAVHRLLKAGGYYDRWRSPVDTTVLGPMAHTAARSPYPGPLGSDLSDDPFRAVVEEKQA